MPHLFRFATICFVGADSGARLAAATQLAAGRRQNPQARTRYRGKMSLKDDIWAGFKPPDRKGCD
jgi:hypothetical protein